MRHFWHSTMLVAKDPALQAALLNVAKCKPGTFGQPDQAAVTAIYSELKKRELYPCLWETAELNRWLAHPHHASVLTNLGKYWDGIKNVPRTSADETAFLQAGGMLLCDENLRDAFVKGTSLADSGFVLPANTEQALRAAIPGVSDFATRVIADSWQGSVCLSKMIWWDHYTHPI